MKSDPSRKWIRVAERSFELAKTMPADAASKLALHEVEQEIFEEQKQTVIEFGDRHAG